MGKIRWKPSLALVAGLAGTLAGITPARADGPTTTDCLQASETSITLRGAHQLREARKQLLICSAASCPVDVRNECLRHVAEVNDTMPTVVFEAKDAAGNDLAAVKINMDGEPISDRLTGTSISLDPGEHVFVFETAGKPPVQKQFVIHEGEKNRREMIVFPGDPGAHDTEPASTATTPATTTTTPGAEPVTPASSGGGQRVAGLVVGGVGIVGLALGGIFGFMASSKWSKAQSDCGAGCAPNTLPQVEKNDAENLALGSTVAFVVGGALVATGIVLFVSAPRAKQTTALRITPAVGKSSSTLLFEGSF